MEQKKSLFLPICWNRVQNQKLTAPLLQMQCTVKTGQFMNCGTRTANGSSAAGNVHWVSELPYKYASYMPLK